MTCDLAKSYLDAYVDRELDPAERLRIEEHLRTCDSCSRHRARLETLLSVIRTESPRYTAPEELRKRIQSDLRGPIMPPLRSRMAFPWTWAAVAASVAVCSVALWQMQLHPRQQRETLIAREVVSSHVRSLMGNHLVDEPSSDQHTVKPWFAGKLDFSPAVKNLDAKGFILTGGRLDYIDGRPVAAIVYRRRQHVINLFVWPSYQSKTEAQASMTENGFNAIRWKTHSMEYWLISDLNPQELELFYQLWSRD